MTRHSLTYTDRRGIEHTITADEVGERPPVDPAIRARCRNIAAALRDPDHPRHAEATAEAKAIRDAGWARASEALGLYLEGVA